MIKIFGPLVLLCSIAVACASSETTVTVPEPTTDQPAADPQVPAETAVTQPAEPGQTDAPADPVDAIEPEQPLEPVADRLPADPDAPAADWVAGVNAAGWGFHRHLEGNAVSSPVSIGTAFSLSRAGASADSAAALDDIFGFPETGTHRAANAVDLALGGASADTTTLEVANRLFPDDAFTMRPEFLEVASTHYGAGIEPVDTADGAAAADAVNRWVSQSTRGLVPVIVDGDTVQDQRLVLVNTVYLKADWAEPFLPEYTRDGPFATGDNRSVTVPFMTDREPGYRRYVRLEGADAVELPYRDGGLAMWLIVPRDRDGLAAVEESLDAAALTALAGAAPDRLRRPHHAQVGADPPAQRPVRVAVPAGILRRRRLRRHRTGHLHHRRAPRRQGHSRREGHRGSRSHRHGLHRIRASPTRPHRRRRPALPVGHHPRRHRRSPVRGPPRGPGRVVRQEPREPEALL